MKKETTEKPLVKAAKAIGKAAGKAAAAVGVHAEPEKPAQPGRFVKKNKNRLPRKLKKKMAKENAAA